MLRHPSLVVNPIRIPVWVYLIVCMISVTANQVFASSFVSMVQMLVYLVIAVFVFSSCITAPEQLLTAYGGFIFTNLIFATAAVVMHAQYILGLHKNALGLEVGYGAPFCLQILWLGRILVHRPARKFALAMCLLSAGYSITSLSLWKLAGYSGRVDRDLFCPAPLSVVAEDTRNRISGCSSMLVCATRPVERLRCRYWIRQ